MNLPPQVLYRPKRERLIALDEPARIQILSQEGGNRHYQIKDRDFREAIAPYLHGDWDDFDRLYRFEESDAVYSGAEHSGDPRLPNITIVPNLRIQETRGLPGPLSVLGCTMGHWHPLTGEGTRTQELYEYQSHGLMVLDRENGVVEVWVMKDGDKIAVPTGCHMTLYNLGDNDHPLVTVGFADPNRNRAEKQMIRHNGPILLAYYTDSEAVFTLNRHYVNATTTRAGVRLPRTLRDASERQVRIPRGARLDLGGLLYEQLTEDPDVIGQFARLGLAIKRGSVQAVLQSQATGSLGPLHVSRPLVHVCRPGTRAYQFFIADAPLSAPKAVTSLQITKHGADVAAKKAADLRLMDLEKRALGIVIEGAGDWTTRCYKRLFEQINSKQTRLTVSYVDNTDWSPSPEWAAGLPPWAQYLDKAKQGDWARLGNLLVDVVFIVTPDFTHGAVAREWLGRAPLVLVEKPFDSQVSNVDVLLQALGTNPTTAVLGLDHYLFNALPVYQKLREIDRHLGGAVASVEFFMTESRPIELGRDRTLQFGLTLDMLPHLLAALILFGDVNSIDEIQVLYAGQYDPLVAAEPVVAMADIANQRAEGAGPNGLDLSGSYRNETASCVSFTFEDYSGSGFRVPCRAVVGKGFTQEVKYLQLIGASGGAIRVDFRGRPTGAADPAYPYEHLFFLQSPAAGSSSPRNLLQVVDPYDAASRLPILRRSIVPLPGKSNRYRDLLDDLMTGSRKAIASTLSREEARGIVMALDRIWQALRDWRRLQPTGKWPTYGLGKASPREIMRGLSQLSNGRS